MKIIERFKETSLRFKIFLFMLLATIPPLVLLGTLSFFQESKMASEAQEKVNDNLAQSAESQILSSLKSGEAILKTITFNRTLGEGFDEFATNSDKYEMFLFLFHDLDPTLNFVQTVNPELETVLFFTDSKLEASRQDIYSLIEAKKFPFKNDMHYTQTYQWYLDDDYVYGVGQFPKNFSYDTFTAVALRYKKDDFFKNLTFLEDDIYAEIVVDDHPQYHIGTHTSKKKLTSSIGIQGSNWKINFYTPSKSNIIFDRIGKTLSVVIFSALMSFFLANIFVNSISENFLKLENKIKTFSENNLMPDLFYTDKNDDFGKLSNSVADMLVQFNQTKNQLHSVEIQNEKSRYDALINQINSHFLYNTLSMINWKAIDLGNEEISIAVQELSKFYRTTLNKGKSITSLRNELENIRAYIYLQLMLNDNFQVINHIDQRLLDIDTINLLLQPIVENSIEHGFVKTKENWKIYITIKEENKNEVAILIGDNGIGIPKEKIQSILTDDRQGYGLKNLNERIKFVFGENYGLKIVSKEGVGTLIKIVLPKKMKIDRKTLR